PPCQGGGRGFESRLPLNPIMWRYSQVVRQRSAKPLSPVQIRLPPPYMPVWRNRQTRVTQNHVPTGVPVRSRPLVLHSSRFAGNSIIKTFFIFIFDVWIIFLNEALSSK